MSDITCPAGQNLRIDAHTSPQAGVNTLVVTRNGVDMTVSFAGPTYQGFPEPEAVQWSTSAPVTLECVNGASNVASAAAGTSAAVVPSVAAADALPFTGGYETSAFITGSLLIVAGLACIAIDKRRRARKTATFVYLGNGILSCDSDLTDEQVAAAKQVFSEKFNVANPEIKVPA